MAEQMKPMYQEDKTKKLLEIIRETDAEFLNETKSEIKMSPGEAKRIELIRRMKEDTDKIEYMIMFNVLMIALTVVALIHFVLFGKLFSLVCVVLGLAYFVYIRKKLTHFTLGLSNYKDNFDRYLWEGFHLKEMRYSAVKLAYFLFFPLFVVFVSDFFRTEDERLSTWLGICIAALISGVAWMIYFSDDKESLESIESELKSLEYLS
jgi:hypothetical protein